MGRHQDDITLINSCVSVVQNLKQMGWVRTYPKISAVMMARATNDHVT